VVDVDGVTGEVTFTKLCGPHGGFPATYKVKTGNGLHLYFKYCERLKNGTNVLGEKVDVRNDNGYVMLPPSSHVSGNVYTVSSDVPLLDVPEWMEPPHRGRGRPKGSVKKSSSHLTLEQISSALQDSARCSMPLGRPYGKV
jgi:Bifunctional DNA primase/polymerase, N-terminal